MMVALEGQANCFLSHRGQLTKCGLEHVRKASSLEQISAEAWEEAIKEVIEAVPTPDVGEGGDGGPATETAVFDEHGRQLDDEVSQAVLPLAAPPSAPLTPGEVAAACTSTFSTTTGVQSRLYFAEFFEKIFKGNSWSPRWR